jgi:hypothetical protein
MLLKGFGLGVGGVTGAADHLIFCAVAEEGVGIEFPQVAFLCSPQRKEPLVLTVPVKDAVEPKDKSETATRRNGLS